MAPPNDTNYALDSASPAAPPLNNKADRRHPLYLGDWERHYANIHSDIAKDDLDEPHLKRKHVILKEHPHIKHLFGYEPSTKYITFVVVGIQLILSHIFGRILIDHTWTMLATAYVVGGTLTAVIGVLIHECTHDLCFKSTLANRVLGLVCNIPVPVPVAQGFRRHHLEHHASQGIIGVDPDLPMAWETRLIRGNILQKVLWMFIFPAMYLIRALALGKAVTKWEAINAVWTIATDIAIWYACGARGLLYLALSLWFGYGLHPAAAHFIQEHYTFEDGQETYSYYGSGNIVLMNVGFHNEHHDFQKVPWTKLPEVKKLASEFYQPLAHHSSWFWVLYEFLRSNELGPQSRVGRDAQDFKNARKTLKHINSKEE